MRYVHTLTSLALLWVLLWGLVPSTHAQALLTLRVDRVDAAEFPRVAVYLTARDARGVPITGLTPEDIAVREDGSPQPRPILDLTTAVNPDQPMRVVLVLDISGSMKGVPLEHAKTAAKRFIARLGPHDQVALIAFSGQVNLEEPFPQLDPAREHGFTADQDALYRVIDGLEAGGATPLYDAVYKAVRLAAQQPPGNRAVLLMTDGRDEDGQGGPGSKVADEGTPIREANRANVPVFTVGLGSAIDAAYLKRLAAETGGTYQETPDAAALERLFQNVADLLKQQYVITYESGVPADGQEHTLEVLVTYRGSTALARATWGPVPFRPTPTPTPTVTPSPVPSPTSTWTPTAVPVVPTPVPTPPVEARGGLSQTWPFVGGGLLAVLLAALAFVLRGRTQVAEETVPCPQCGYPLKPDEYTCPECGYVRRK